MRPGEQNPNGKRAKVSPARGRGFRGDDIDARVRANFSVLTGINGVTAANLSGEDLSIRDDGTFTIVVSPDAAPANPEQGMNYIQAPSNSTILATRNTLGDWNTETPMKSCTE